jgi:hypothetical protein
VFVLALDDSKRFCLFPILGEHKVLPLQKNIEFSIHLN